MTILFAIVLFSVLIFVHELGHFVAAKLSGVRVNEFSMFMGPALWKKQVGDTLYAIRLIPIGGYCAMEGEDGGSTDPHSFDKAAWWKRLIILVAGAAMNFLIGVVLMVVVYLPVQRAAMPVIGTLQDYCTAAGENGLQVGDRIVELDGERIYIQSDFSLLLSLSDRQSHDFLVERDGQKILLEDLPLLTTEVVDEEGNTRRLYGLGFTVVDMDLGRKLEYAWNVSMDTVRLVRLSLQMLLRGQVGLKDLSGPVGIVQQMSEVAGEAATWFDALMNLLYFGGFIAINLAVMNLLPIPALDGGRVVGLLLTTAVEAVTKKKIDPIYEGYLHGAGMVILLGLMILVLFKDIFYLFR